MSTIGTRLKTPKTSLFLFYICTTYNVNMSSGGSVVAQRYTLSNQKTTERDRNIIRTVVQATSSINQKIIKISSNIFQ